MTTEQILSQVPLFRSLPQEEIDSLASALNPVELMAGATIFQEGSRDRRFYIVVEGQVEVYKKMDGEERLLATLKTGDLIGEMSLFSEDGSHTASVRALTDLRLLEMPPGQFDAMLHRQPELAYDLLSLLSQRLEQSENVTIRDLRNKNLELTVAYRELQEAHEQLLEKGKLEHEMQLASQIQRQILPQVVPTMACFDLGARMVPARQVGGDFFDFIALDDTRLGVVVGDVSDKGMPAALLMGLVYSLVRAEASRGLPAVEVLKRVNSHLLDIGTVGMYVTALYGILDCARRQFAFARAGHLYPLLLNSRGQPQELERTPGAALGVFPDPPLVETTVALPPGCVMLIYSDGLTEAAGQDGGEFGQAGAIEQLRQSLSLNAQDMVDSLLSEIQEFSQPNPCQDDITLVVIRAVE
jgi:serine phosphatase RsbU (regulator of sigma subunit)